MFLLISPVWKFYFSFFLIPNHLYHSLPEPTREQCPPDIEQLLRDYSRAREEAKTEIAKARERLRERTELEKQRIQQQTRSQGIKVSCPIYNWQNHN